VATGLLLGFSLLFARGVQLQLLQREHWAKLANEQIWRSVRFEPRRGEIHDRNGEKLAVSIEMESLAANPRLVSDPFSTAGKLAASIDVPAGDLAAKLQQPRAFVWLKHYLSPRQADAVRALELTGIHFVMETRRYYPNVELAGHVLGFVGRDHHGLEGLELSQDALLRGHPGTHTGATDARGRIIYPYGLPPDAPPQGYSLRLSLDKRVQYICERELQATVNTYGAKSGTVVVTRPETGEVLAMATFPSFNPNTFASSSPTIWRNRAVTDTFEPGSTFKMFLAAAALEHGLAHPQDLFYCEQGSYRIKNHTIHDPRKFRWLSLAQILRFSSNIGAAKIGQRLGAKRYYHALRAFGFGARTGTDLPGETPGLLRPPEKWSAVDVAAASFGQSLSVSTMQLAMAVSAVANGGRLMRPLLVTEVLNARGELIRRREPEVIRRVISAATAERLKLLLADVVTREGTGARAALAQYRAAGKTGTAQKSTRESAGYAAECYNASFVGFVPVENPQIAVVVVINEPQKAFYGGVVAAPTFRRIARQTLHCLRIMPEQVSELARHNATRPGDQGSLMGLQPASYERPETDGRELMPDLTGLSLRVALNRLGTFRGSLDIRGSGRVVWQSPEPGSNLATVRSCRLILAAD
jgi:cell division protein FtsI (penicillin-binding protein 3)